MSRIFYTWELGSNLGHLGSFSPLASALASRGHEVFVAARETATCARLIGASGRWFQSPVVAEEVDRASPISYADILLCNGYADESKLLGLVVAWRQLIELTQPQLILIDHAPTAILAARTLGVPCMFYGSGFHHPPRLDPLPGMRPWQPTPKNDLIKVNAQALGTVNTVLDRLGRSPLGQLADLFQVAEDGLLTLPELDHYPQRGVTRYWGFVSDSRQKSAPTWPPGNGKKVFVYLREGHPHSRGALETLARSGCSLLAFLPQSALGDHLESFPNVAISRDPLDMDRLTREADAAVLNGGMSGTAAFLLAGKPVLCLPTQLEQFLTGWNLSRMGAGLLVSPQDIAPGMSAVVGRLLDDPGLRGAAAGFAAKYVHLDQPSVIASLVGRIETLCTTAH